MSAWPQVWRTATKPLMAFWILSERHGRLGGGGHPQGIKKRLAQRRRPARRGRAHDLALTAADMGTVIAKIDVAMAAENAREFERPLSTAFTSAAPSRKSVQGAARPRAPPGAERPTSALAIFRWNTGCICGGYCEARHCARVLHP